MRQPRKRQRRRKARRGPVDQTALAVGTRLRTLRKGQKLPLVELARRSRVDMATISRIETGRMTGTVESHLKLASALGVKLTDLYQGIEEARTKDAVSFQAAAEREGDYLYRANKTSVALLTTDILKKKLMPTLLTIEPGGSTPQEEAKVGTERFIFMLDGQLEATIGETTHQLQRNSTLYFDASVPHQLQNVGRTPAKCISIVTPPVL